MLARDVMSPQVQTAIPADTIAAVAQQMMMTNARLVVIVGTEDAPIGVMTEHDVVQAAARGMDPSRDTIADHMSKRVAAIAPTTALEELARRMVSGEFEHVPVVEGGTLVGVVSVTDVLAWSLERENAELS